MTTIIRTMQDVEIARRKRQGKLLEWLDMCGYITDNMKEIDLVRLEAKIGVLIEKEGKEVKL